MTLRDVYLTVDLDYWDWVFIETNHGSPKAHSSRFFDNVIGCKRPIDLCVEHHHILRFLKGKNYHKVVNVDYHDDISELYYLTSKRPDSASWVNFVPFQTTATYEWRYPDHHHCITEGNGLCTSPKYVLWPTRKHYWRAIRRVQGVKGIPWSRVDRISVVLSPYYTSPMSIMDALERILALKRVKPSRAVMAVVEEWRKLFPY